MTFPSSPTYTPPRTIAGRDCLGPATCSRTGFPYCRLQPTDEPEDGDWARHCAICQDGRERWDELRGECEREADHA